MPAYRTHAHTKRTYLHHSVWTAVALIASTTPAAAAARSRYSLQPYLLLCSLLPRKPRVPPSNASFFSQTQHLRAACTAEKKKRITNEQTANPVDGWAAGHRRPRIENFKMVECPSAVLAVFAVAFGRRWPAAPHKQHQQRRFSLTLTLTMYTNTNVMHF